MSMVVFKFFWLLNLNLTSVFSQSRLDLALKEVEIFAFLLKQLFEQKWTIIIFWMCFNVPFDNESENSIRMNLPCLFFDISEVFILEQKF